MKRASPLSPQQPTAGNVSTAAVSEQQSGGVGGAAAAGGGGVGPELDLDSTLNDMTLRTATATITSLEEFLSAVPKNEDPVARRAIDDLRKEITDKVVRSKVMRMPKELCECMVTVLEGDQQLMMTQCTRERANIVSPLIEKLGTETTFTLIRFMLDNLVTIAKSMGGCVALPRVLAQIRPSQADVFFETALGVMSELVPHEYGNFVVKHLATNEAYCGAIIRQHLTNPATLVAWATTKPGSHVIETVLANALPGDFEAVCRSAMLSPAHVRALAHDRYGNYCVQTVFKGLQSKVSNAQLHSECAQVAARCAKDSPFAQNIMKRVAQGHRKYRDVRRGSAANSPQSNRMSPQGNNQGPSRVGVTATHIDAAAFGIARGATR